MHTGGWFFLLEYMREMYEVRVKLFEQIKRLDCGIHRHLAGYFYQYHVLPAHAIYQKIVIETTSEFIVPLHPRR